MRFTLMRSGGVYARSTRMTFIRSFDKYRRHLIIIQLDMHSLGYVYRGNWEHYVNILRAPKQGMRPGVERLRCIT